MEIDKRINGYTKLIGLIGNPVEHTISPFIHNTICRETNTNMVYVPFRVDKDNLENVVRGFEGVGIVGFNVTIPYKRDIIKHLDENTRESLLMGAVNTVKNSEGKLIGYNTDAEGFVRSFKEESGESFNGKKVVIIGAGGASRAVAVKIAREGARQIYIMNRTPAKADEIAQIINENLSNIVKTCAYNTKRTLKILSECDVIINTTAIGMYPEINETPVKEKSVFSEGQIVYDVIYNPSETRFLREASERGAKAINGLGMLVYQAVFAFEIWTEKKVSDDIVKKIRDYLSS